MVFGGILPNHTLAGLLKVIGKALHMISFETPWRCMVVLNVAMWSQGSRVPSYESRIDILNLEGRGWLVMDAIKKESVLYLIHVIFSSHVIFHLFHGSFHLVHLHFQMSYPTSNGTFGLVFFSIVFSPSILWILPMLLTTALSTVSINFSC